MTKRELKRFQERWNSATEKVNKEMAEILLSLPD